MIGLSYLFVIILASSIGLCGLILDNNVLSFGRYIARLLLVFIMASALGLGVHILSLLPHQGKSMYQFDVLFYYVVGVFAICIALAVIHHRRKEHILSRSYLTAVPFAVAYMWIFGSHTLKYLSISTHV